MDWITWLTIMSGVLAILGMLATLRSFFASIRAERAWVAGLKKLELSGMLTDLVNEERLVGGSDAAREQWRRIYLSGAVKDVLALLGSRQAISQQDLRRIEAALEQPTESGRRNYARKLVEEGLQGRVLIA